MTDRGQYPWALGSISRALFFYAQSQSETDRRALSAISIYYSLFHLGMFLVYSCPKHQDQRLQEKIRKGRGPQGKQDPNREVSHQQLIDFLKACTKQGLSRPFVEYITKARDVRHFINYGPRVRWTEDRTIFVDTCDYRIDVLSSLRKKLPESFQDSVAWARKEGADNGIWISHVLSQAKPFFTGDAHYYADWCTENESRVAESLRASLEDIAHKTANVTVEKLSIC